MFVQINMVMNAGPLRTGGIKGSDWNYNVEAQKWAPWS